MSTQAINDRLEKDEETVASEISNEEGLFQKSIVVNDGKKEGCSNYFVGAVIIAVIVATVMIFLVSGTTCGYHSGEPEFQQEEPPSFEYSLYDGFAPVSAVSLFYRSEGDLNQVGFIDEEGCFDLVYYQRMEDNKVASPLCNEYTKDIRSLEISENYSMIAHGNVVEVWHAEYSMEVDARTWVEVPAGTGSNIISVPDVTGFGKKIERLSDERIIVASDEAVHYFEFSEESTWIEAKRWEGVIGFDVDPERTNLAIYNAEEITIYDLSTRWHLQSYEPIVHKSPKKITSAAVSEHGTRVHIVTDHGYNTVTVMSLFASNIKGFNTPTKLVGDIVYSLHTGCMFNFRTGKYLSVTVEDIDDIFDVQIAGDRIAVLLERDGVKMVDVYKR